MPRASSPSSSSSRTSSGSATSTPPSARVLSSDPSNFSHTIDISKGSDDGLKVGMPVVNGAGLVGRIVQVTPNRSTVQLITDPDFLVGVRLLGSDLATGTAHGQGQGEDLLVDTRLEPDDRRPAQARHRAHHERRAAQRVPRLDPGRARCARSARPAAGSRSSWSCDPWPTRSGCSSSPCSSGSRRRDPSQPAHRRGAHVVRARHRPHAPARRRWRTSRSSGCRPI